MENINIKDDNNNRMTITRKYAIIPTSSPYKEWKKKVYNFTVEDLEFRIKYNEEKLKSIKNKEEKQKIGLYIDELKKSLQNVKDGNDFTQKMINDYTYHLVRESMESESARKNYILSWMRDQLRLNHVAQFPSLAEKKKFVSDTINCAYRVKGSKKGSLFDDTDIKNALGSYGIAFCQNLTEIIKGQIEDGLLEGKCNPVEFKCDSPFTVAKTAMGFSHNYKDICDLQAHIDDKDCKLYFDFGGNGNPTIARFRINLGSWKNRDELKATLLKVYTGEYQYCGSSIQISKNKIILNLSLSIPKKEMELDENTVVGVDLGIKIPAVCALNNNPYARLYIGSVDDFIRVKTQLQAQKRRLSIALKNTSGGHGRKKKLKPLDRFNKRELHFTESYCHKVSREVVDFAVKHRAKYINVENLTGYDTSDFVLRNWNYYRLQNYITYKAAKYGIIVRKINPCYTSQVCSVCGNWHEENRPKGDKGQAYFNCHNEDCLTHDKKKFKYGINADFNAARNIAMSTLFMEKGQVTEASKKAARKYYGIPEPNKNNKVEEVI